MHVVASVQARLGSTRLPGKVLYHLGNRRLLQRVVDRTLATDTVDETIATIGDQPENDAVTEYCERAGIEYSVGPENDLLSRHRAVAADSDADLLVRITADCPFVPAAEIDRVVGAHLSNDARYTTNVTDDMPVGTAVDAIDADVLAELASLEERHPVKLPRAEPDQWGTVWNDNPAWADLSDAHLAVDTPADYWSLEDAIAAVGDDPRAVAEWVTQ